MKDINKVLILGSGALKIGQAGEFDYSGSQAIKAFKEEGITTILVNPNIATIQTSEQFADKVYFLPIDEYFVEKIIKKEKPDAIALSFGGQTALNCGIELYKKGVFEKYSVEVLGTSVNSIILSEDRKKFANHLKKIGVATPRSKAANSLSEAKKVVSEIGFPVMIRAAFALGGQKSGIAYNKKQFESIVDSALTFSPQVLIEQYLHHYKEIEYEVIRDKYDNCVTVCNMENMDPMGIHTGESIVVAPSQTLTNFEYHALRSIAIKIVRSLNIVGECNVQFALNPHPTNSKSKILNPNKIQKTKIKNLENNFDHSNLEHLNLSRNSKFEIRNFSLEYYVIELNPRLSRSSALASKATGYPLAYVAANLILGKGLTEIKNQVTKVTQSCFEPALDYLVVKIPRWDLEKFKGVNEKIGSSMKSVGEIMAIGRNFEETIQKAVRMLDIGAQGITENNFPKDDEKFMYYLKTPTPKRLFALAEGMKRKIAIGEIHKLTGIDPWFLYRIKKIVEIEEKLTKENKLNNNNLAEAKQVGISDKQVGILTNKTELEVRELRKRLKVFPSVFQIDTLAGEFPAKTNYLYLTYNGSHNDVKPLKKEGIMVLGSGPYRIGSSVEFDWTCVNTALGLKKYHKKSIIINCNPETVSTDYDISNRLYFEELSFERVLDIYEFEKSQGVIVSVGGQTPNNLVRQLSSYGVEIFGTKAENIDRAEDRSKFSLLLDQLSIPQPAWNKLTTLTEAIDFCKRVEYPVLIRPSYVLSGSSMNVCYNEDDLKHFTKIATIVNKDYPITVSKFMEDSKEIELDAVAQEGNILIYAISEHVEHAGVHSGDATIVFPPQKIYLQTEKKVIDIAEKLARSLKICGPFNIQYIARENEVFVIEINLRSSRTFPLLSKATGVNFAQKLVDAFFHKGLKAEIERPDYVVVKVPQFSFSRLAGADPVLRVEMSSTGEVACFGKTIEEAFLKAYLSVGPSIPKKGIFLSLGEEENKIKFLDSILRIKHLNIPIYATEKTAKFLRENGIKARHLYKIHEKKTPNILTYFQDKKVDFAINIKDPHVRAEIDDDYIIRRFAIDHNIPLLTDRQKAELFIKAMSEKKLDDLEILDWKSYLTFSSK